MSIANIGVGFVGHAMCIVIISISSIGHTICMVTISIDYVNFVIKIATSVAAIDIDSIRLAVEKLKEEGVVKPLKGWRPKVNPLPPNWEHGKFYEYHNFSGHDTEKCTSLKNHLQDLIERRVLEKGDLLLTLPTW